MNEDDTNVRFLSAISYIGVLFLVGHFAVEKNNPDLRFHKYQGGILCAVFSFLYLTDLLLCLLLSFDPALQGIIAFIVTVSISIAYLMMMAMGISSAVHFRQQQLPFIGFYAVRLREKLDSKKRK